MKKNDIAIIILIASISVIVAYFVGRAVIGDPDQQAVEVYTIEPITTEVRQPEASVFNDRAINPTVEINIGDSANQQPFGG